MNLDSISLTHVISWFLGTCLSGTGIVLILKFFGSKLIKQLLTETIDEEYERNLKEKIINIVELKTAELKSSTFKDFNSMLDNHAAKCKSDNIEMNDNRYLLRQEFKMFLENQNIQNEKVSQSISELRDVCNQILLRLSEK
jgi:hypothetical protein